MNFLYFDYAATTPLDPRVAQKMARYLTLGGVFANPSSLHSMGQEAKQAVETARAQVADLINADPEEIIWTSGATEADNLALKGAASLYQRKGKHIVTLKTEHKAVLDSCQHLEKLGFELTYLTPETNGLLSLDQLKSALRADTILVSIMHVNNETGVVQDIEAIAQLTAAQNILFHVDAAQSIGKIKIDLKKNPIDLLSMCAHKIYGPKGIGGLYLRKKPRVRVEPLIHGGGHEQGMRSGTLPTHQIVGMGEAFSLAQQEMHHDTNSIKQWRDRFLNGLAGISQLRLNTDISFTIPHILSLRFEGLLADAMLAQLPQIAASTASACVGKGVEGSYVLRAMGLTIEQIKNSVRFSFGRFTSENEVESAIQSISQLFN